MVQHTTVNAPNHGNRAQAVLARAEQVAAYLEAEARANAEQQLTDARIEADRIVAVAKEKADRLMREAKAESERARRLMATATQDAASTIEELDRLSAALRSRFRAPDPTVRGVR
jgi:F0F1-type ATP synthase membrane subunit b/b'